MPQSPAPFVWYELMTSDAAAAEKFYKTVVGWKTQDMSQGDMKYTGLLAGDAPVAGLMTLPKEACAAGAKPGWIGYIGVDDVDATAGRVTKAGGRDSCAADRHSQCRPLRHRRRPAGHGVLPLQACRRDDTPGRRSGQAGHRRMARALCDRRPKGLRLLRRPVRLDQGRGDGYGRDGRLPDLRRRRRRRSAA